MKYNIAVFVESVDPLFLPEKHRKNSFAIVAKDTPLFIYTKSVFPRENIIGVPMFYSNGKRYSERKLLYSNEFLQEIKQKHITHIVVPSKCTKVMLDWAKKNKIKLIGTPYRQQANFENKIYFDKFLKKNNISSPQTLSLPSKKSDTMYVVQEPTKWSLLGTTFCHSFQEVQNTVKKTKQKLLIREFIDGIPLGVSILVDGKGNYTFSALRRQCFLYKKNFPKTFLGIQWMPTKFFNQHALSNLENVLEQLAKALQTKKFQGIANIDLILSDDIPYIIECNPRLSAATAHVFSIPGLTPLKDPYSFFLNTFLDKKNFPLTSHIPNSSYQGSFLAIDIEKPRTVKKLPSPGIYEQKKEKVDFITTGELSLNSKQLVMIHYLQNKGLYENEEMATIVSNRPLFDYKTGTLNADGKVIFDFFTKEFFE